MKKQTQIHKNEFLLTFPSVFFFADLHTHDTPIAERQRYALRDEGSLSDLAADQQHVSSYGWLVI